MSVLPTERRERTMKKDELSRCVLEAVANDYEQFDSILSQLSSWKRHACTEISDHLVAERLMSLIAAKLVRAYLLSPAHPTVTEVDASDDGIRGYWFYITARGKQVLLQLENEEVN
jgi:hypothetical protein